MLQSNMKTFLYTFNNNNLNNLIPYKKFKDEKNILVQIFCGHKGSTLQLISSAIKENIPQAICIGTTTDGEISNKRISTLKTIIAISVFKHTHIKGHFLEEVGSTDTGFKIAKTLKTNNTKLIITFTDGIYTNAEDYLKGIELFDKHLMVCGGMAGDNGVFKKTHVCLGDKMISKGVVAVSLNSDILEVKNAHKFDWLPIGIEHRIDKVVGNRIYEIGGMSAKAFYVKYLGDSFAPTEYPLIVKRKGINIARAVLTTYDDGSLGCAGNLYEGDMVHLGFANAEMLMQNPIEYLEHINTFKAETIFIYSCMARRRYMPNLIKIETEPFARIATTAGFFTYAEFYHNNDHNELLNQTLTLVALTENQNIETMNVSPLKRKMGLNQSAFMNTTKSLTSLIQQSTKDYKEQSFKLQEEKNYSQHLLKSQKQFLRHAVHETNTPLSVIMSNIELFEMENGKNKYLKNIEVAMKNIFSIYDDLSYLVKKDQIEYKKHPIDLVDYIRARSDFFEEVANKNNSNFIFTAQNPSMFIYFNETKLQRIIDNNLTNAIKYSYENEDIKLTLTEEKNTYTFLVSSYSRQIIHPEKIFEEYYREEKSQEGFGLGLNLVKRICDEENVEIHLKSNEFQTSFAYVFKKGEQ